MIAILLPSRSRPDRLLKTIMSALNTAENIEICIRLDDDDDITLKRLDEFQKLPKTKITIGPRYTGYTSLNRFYTELADSSKAEWISIMNDDAVYIGKDWDKKIGKFPTNGFILQPEFYGLGGSNYINCEGGAFPFVPNGCWKKYLNIITTPHIPDPVDTALDEILRKQNGWKTGFIKGFKVQHNRDKDEDLAAHRTL